MKKSTTAKVVHTDVPAMELLRRCSKLRSAAAFTGKKLVRDRDIDLYQLAIGQFWKDLDAYLKPKPKSKN